jgi:hypothetical protein
LNLPRKGRHCILRGWLHRRTRPPSLPDRLRKSQDDDEASLAKDAAYRLSKDDPRREWRRPCKGPPHKHSCAILVVVVAWSSKSSVATLLSVECQMSHYKHQYDSDCRVVSSTGTAPIDANCTSGSSSPKPRQARLDACFDSVASSQEQQSRSGLNSLVKVELGSLGGFVTPLKSLGPAGDVHDSSNNGEPRPSISFTS